MPIISDMEIIKSAIIYGDLDDAMAVVKGRLKSLSYSLKGKPSRKKSEYSQFLSDLEKLLSGNISLDDFKGATEKLDTLMDSLDITGDRENFLASFYYLLEYSLDRYNIRYPSFDGKRCDDK